ncbi:2-oxoacid:acceptor oxidoreductase subunit alpha [Algoriphagus sp.]|uniref:2-oxoacid:acceptor oxidoreductase subunit alpha n=1 Tax=Algoriphagus sp. TaxID=1872435 RepID=UPI00271C6AA2|nr:2-oxoacid:acceptor oxidoreductase subunit alpha [Algoriphagus sp.]MDO8967739.1 2-oxoacid:acceptor oxidoreductase subunit alpha [Algoriphagus sp.]MDP3200023.1 2-oxoacid:acceptor oxidoreductase subunit alpha [Algoriphagus sp.]
MKTRINDFIVRFANVNGTGSASANYLFAKTIFRMGIPVTPKNIFPSNIQGLPTWYEVRVSEKGYLGRREGIDLMISVNPQSMAKDVQSVKPGGYFIYDSTKKLNPDYERADIHYLGIPMMEMATKAFEDPRKRQLLKNIIYVGALVRLLDMDQQTIRELISEQFEGKKALIEANFQALTLGMEFVEKNYDFPLSFRLEKRNLLENKILVDGNTACGLGAVYGGATLMAWYPITPSTSVAEAFESFCEKYRRDEDGKNKYAFIQAEDELAAMGMVIGANWNGARAFTATSGPGVSLMSEFLGLGYFAEVPAVLIDVQRAGPSTGMPTRTQQSDLLAAGYASHGDTKHILLFPASPKECFELTAEAFDLAEQLQTPVFVMTDLDLGMNDHVSDPFEWEKERKYQRGKVLTTEDLENIGKYGRYLDSDGDGIPYRTYPGTHPTKGAFFTRGTSKDEYAAYTEDGAAYKRNMDRLTLKWNTAKTLVPNALIQHSDTSSSLGILYFGTSTFSSEEARDILSEEGIQVDSLRLKAFPFGKEVEDFVESHRVIFVIEQNRDAQMRKMIVMELNCHPQKLVPILNYDGMPITADAIKSQIVSYLNTESNPNHELSKATV